MGQQVKDGGSPGAEGRAQGGQEYIWDKNKKMRQRAPYGSCRSRFGFPMPKPEGPFLLKSFLKVLSSKEGPENQKDHRGPLVIHTNSPLACPRQELPLHYETVEVLWFFPLLAEKSIPSLSMASAECHKHCVTHWHFHRAERSPRPRLLG